MLNMLEVLDPKGSVELWLTEGVNCGFILTI